MTNTDNTSATHIHPFEKAGLGTFPFRLIGVQENMWSPCPGVPAKPGGCCDYCSNGIRYEFVIRGADGSEFVVGSSCVFQVCKKGERILTDVERETRRIKREASSRRADDRAAAAVRHLATLGARRTLRDIPHPNKWRAEQGATMLDWAVWMFRHSGRSGSLKVVRSLNRSLGTKI